MEHGGVSGTLGQEPVTAIAQATFTNTGYPISGGTPLQQVAFNESDVLRAASNESLVERIFPAQAATIQ